jgi:organic radical activating enzyme
MKRRGKIMNRRRFEYLIGRVRDKIKTNFIRFKYEGKYKGMIVPWVMQLEPTNVCNANCTFCRRDQQGDSRGYMDFELFKEIIDATPFITQVHTQGYGEPLLHPRIADMVEYARKAGKRVIFYTNGAPLNNELAMQLLEADLSQIRFSVDAITADEYEKQRPPLKFERVLKNIEMFQDYRDIGGYKTSTMVRMIKGGDVEAKRAFWEKRVDSVAMSNIYYVPTPEDLEPPIRKGNPIYCTMPYEQIAIDWRGDISYCCMSMYGTGIVANVEDVDGTVTEENIIKLFNSGKMKDIRNGLLAGLYPARCEWCVKDVMWGKVQPLFGELENE